MSYAWDRMVMMLFALVEFVLGIVLITAIGQLNGHITNEVMEGANTFTNPVNNKSQDLRDVVRTMLGWSIGMAVWSLVSVVVVSLYYTLGKALNYYRDHVTSMKPDSLVRKLIKMLIIAVGALGIVGVVAAMGILSGTSVAMYTMTCSSDAKKKEILELFGASVLYGLVVLIFKLLEALLGHAWAIGLSNKQVEMMTASNGPSYNKA